MEYKLLLITATILVLSQNAESRKCYRCHSILPNRTCFDVDVNTIPVQECDKTNTRLEDVFIRPDIDRTLLEKAENATEYECVRYELKSTLPGSNQTEKIRSCIPKTIYNEFCKFKENDAWNESKNLTECVVCTGDLCNGPRFNNTDPDSATGLNVSLFISVISLTFAILFK